MIFPRDLFFTDDDKMPFYWFNRWLNKRVFEPLRPDRDILLKSIGLKEYNVIDIIEKTKGVVLFDEFTVEIIR